MIYILLASSFLTLLITTLQLYIDYRNDVNSIETRLVKINESYAEVLAQGLWDLDQTQVDNMLKGILKFSDIQYLEVFSKHERSFARAGEIQEEKVITLWFPVEYAENKIGRLRVDATLKGVYQRLQKKVFLILGSQSIKTFFISIFILFIVQYLITRHLVTMAYYARNLGIKNLDHVLALQRAGGKNGQMDELEMVVDAINGMRVKLLQDIAIQKNQESELLFLRNYLSSIIDSMPSMLVGVDINGKITQWNKTAEQVTGLRADAAQGQTLLDAFPQMAPQMDNIYESIRTGETLREQKQTQHPGKAFRYEDITVYPLVSNGVEGAVIRVDDITDKVRLEEMMIQSEKMLSVGGLAAGMAHEINNPLAGMMQNAEVIQNRLSSTKIPANITAADEIGIKMEDISAFMEKRDILNMLKAVNDSGYRISEIVENMLNFARKGDSDTSLEDISVLLDDTLALAETDYDMKKQHDFKRIVIKKEYDEALPHVSCEGMKIQQVLLNILRNGAQAMQDADVAKPVFILRTVFDEKQKRVLIEIEDNGPGMEEEVVKRVFEPFFTTKPVGVGTGLGLSVSYFIVTENHGGTLSVESTPGKGAKFIIGLPLEGRPA